MTMEEITAYCLGKSGAVLAYPFGEIPVCVKVKGRLFAQLYPTVCDCKITLNCDVMTGEFYRRLYPGAVTRGYHCPPVQQPYFNTILLDGTVPNEELYRMIDHSYQTVTAKLSKKLQRELEEENPIRLK